MSDDVIDIAVLGGGCAGLGFAMQYAGTKSQETVTIFENRKNYQGDRHWSFWLHNKDHFIHRDILKSEWSEWSFSKGGTEYLHQSHEYAYCTIDSADYYQKAQSIIESDNRLFLNLGIDVFNVSYDEESKLYNIDTSKGQYQARKIIDCRSHYEAPQKDYAIYQIFYGAVIESKNAFVNHQAGLMTNMTHEDHGFSFLYLLPFSKDKALIEYTVFSKIVFPPEILKPFLSKYLDDYFQNYDILKEEQAILPMNVFIDYNQRLELEISYIRLGKDTGALRAATGYGFVNIYKQINDLILNLNDFSKVNKTPNALLNWMDRVLLKIIHDHPQKMPNIFLALSKNMPTNSFARFMNNNPNYYDIVRLIMAVPPKPFMKAALSRDTQNF
ncbi:MAG: lycopene cyclase family protein [Pseudomonadota bacterium]